MKRKVINLTLIGLAIFILGASIYVCLYFSQRQKAQTVFAQLKEKRGDSKELVTSNDGNQILSSEVSLYELNTDYIGWLKINDTNIDYPVMYTNKSFDFYLYKNFYKEYDKAGTLFIEMQSQPLTTNNNRIIYGHNMRSDGSMFHDLLKYEKENFYQSHKTFNFTTIYVVETYEVIAAFYTQIYPETYEGFRYDSYYQLYDQEDYETYINGCKSLMEYEINETVSFNDNLLTLSTCAYHVENGRFVVVAKQIQ